LGALFSSSKREKNSAPMERPNGQNKKNIKVRIQKKKRENYRIHNFLNNTSASIA
jgi:hypothetical protein